MPTLVNYISQVLSEFGDIIPSPILSFQDVAREFLNVYMLEMQKLGISNTNITVEYFDVTSPSREFNLRNVIGKDVFPAFIEFYPNNSIRIDKVEIVPLDKIPTYEGGKAAAFFGNPLKIKLSWDYWKDGKLRIYYDPIYDLTSTDLAENVSFPPNFIPYIVKKTAYYLIGLILLKASTLSYVDSDFNLQNFVSAMNAIKENLNTQIIEWSEEFRKFKNIDRNFQPRLRRTWDELQGMSYDNVTGNYPLKNEG